MPIESLSLVEARRIAIAAQGYGRPRPSGAVTADHLREVLKRLSVVQIDFVNVLVPAHYLVFFSRLGPYPLRLLDSIVYGGRRWSDRQRPVEFTEQWAHEASIVPVELWPLLRHRMETHRPRPWGFERFIEAHPEYMAWALEQLRAQGPLGHDELTALGGPPDFDPKHLGRIPGAWHGSVPRAVLEAHLGRGLVVAVERRPNFARSYDLAERIVPPELLTREVSQEDAERELLLRAARAYGVGTADDLADYFRMPIRRVRARLADMTAAGDVQQVSVEGWREPAYLHPDASSRSAGKGIATAALISPFDPLVWYRPRLLRLFNFDYRIEIFVPEKQRRWGYYVLPFLLGDRLVARVDLRADRENGQLDVRAAYLETASIERPLAVLSTARGARSRATSAVRDFLPDGDTVAAALVPELHELAYWLKLDAITVSSHKGFSQTIVKALDIAASGKPPDA